VANIITRLTEWVDDVWHCLYYRGMIEILDLLGPVEPEQRARRLAADVVFCSPVAEYRGRRDVAHLLGLIARVVSEVQPSRTWGGEGDGESVQAFTARVGDHALEGIVREHVAQTGELSHITLFLRPYRTLKVAIEQMGALLTEFPLPSRSSTTPVGSARAAAH
jgi:hypothetical protein